jgi:hypothetical protein
LESSRILGRVGREFFGQLGCSVTIAAKSTETLPPKKLSQSCGRTFGSFADKFRDDCQKLGVLRGLLEIKPWLRTQGPVL